MESPALSRGNPTVRLPLVTLGFILCVFVARVQEIFPPLSHFYLGKLAVALALILSIKSGRLRDVLGWKATKLFAALWLLGAITIPISLWPAASFGFWEKSLTSIFIFYLFLACYSTDYDNCMSFAKGMAICGLLICIEIVFLRGRFATGRLDITSGTLDPNELALTLVCIIPFVFTLFQTGGKFRKFWTSGLVALIFPAIFITQSRGGVIGLFFVVLASLFSHGARLRTKVIVIILALSTLLFMPNHLIGRFDHVWKGTDYNYSVGRLLIWKEGASLFFSHILTGVGGNQSPTAMGMAYGHAHWRAMHDIFLQIGLEFGLPGLLLFLAILYSIGKNIRGTLGVLPDRKSPQGMLFVNSQISLLGYVCCGIFLADAYSPIVAFLLGLTSGFAHAAALTQSDRNALRSHGQSIPRWDKAPPEQRTQFV
jgi:hypothetical protein